MQIGGSTERQKIKEKALCGLLRILDKKGSEIE